MWQVFASELGLPDPAARVDVTSTNVFKVHIVYPLEMG